MKWYEARGKEADVVVSTRIRLARNIRNCPFPWRMSLSQKREALAFFRQSLQEIFPGMHFLGLEERSDVEVISLVERHLLHPEIVSERAGCGLLVTEDESVSILLGGEDHIRIQVLCAGFHLQEAYAVAEQMDELPEKSLPVAFDDRYGYLTQRPGDLGTGMKASLLMHLPAMQESNAIRRVADNLHKIGFTVRGVYGDWSDPKGALYQVSNQVTLGLSERAALENLQGIATQILQRERGLWKEMAENESYQDRIWRSCGVLRSARILNNDEFMKLISNVRFGISAGMMDNITLETINRLMIEAQPATLMERGKTDMAGQEKLRAEVVREALR